MRRILTILLSAGLAVAGLLGASPASAQVAPTAEISSAVLVGRGEAVRVTYTVTCAAGASAFLITDITQGPARGEGYVDFITCTGSPQVFTPTVTGASPARFRPGTGEVGTLFDVCTFDGDCQYVQKTEQVTLTRS